MELIIILLIGQACGYVEFYTAEMPDYIVGCSNYDNLNATMDYWQPFIEKTDYQMIYVIDDRMAEMPRFHEVQGGWNNPPDGFSKPEQGYGVAWRYVQHIEHEAEHLTCGCNFHN